MVIGAGAADFSGSGGGRVIDSGAGLAGDEGEKREARAGEKRFHSKQSFNCTCPRRAGVAAFALKEICAVLVAIATKIVAIATKLCDEARLL